MRQSYIALLRVHLSAALVCLPAALVCLPAALVCLPAALVYPPAALGDDFKIMKLEQDMRNVERQVQELSRQLSDLQQRASRAGDRQGFAPSSTPSSAPSTEWLNASLWKRVRPGMTELEVIELLGPPTSMRGAADSGTRQLMYAMEIGSSGFLGGSVLLEDRRVVEVQVPTLR